MKSKKYLLLLVSGLVLSTHHSYAQKDSSGIYQTSTDFEQRKLTYAINCKTEKHKINPTVIFKGDEVKVKHGGTTYELKKSEVFGYRACNGQEYRFVDDKEYKILNPGEPLTIYMYQHPAHSGKDISKGLYKPEYYFGIKDASLQPLTIANIKGMYPGNHKLHDAFDAVFKEDRELYTYDNFHKMFKLNWVLKNNGN